MIVPYIPSVALEVFRVRDALTLGVEQLDHLRAAVLDGAFGGLGA